MNGRAGVNGRATLRERLELRERLDRALFGDGYDLPDGWPTALRESSQRAVVQERLAARLRALLEEVGA